MSGNPQTVAAVEAEQIDRANASGRTPVAFIHGLWLSVVVVLRPTPPDAVSPRLQRATRRVHHARHVRRLAHRQVMRHLRSM